MQTLRNISKILSTGAVVALLVMGVACKKPPVPGRVAVAGDSVIWQSLLYGGEYHGADFEQKTAPGTVAAHAIPRVERDVDGYTTSPDVLVIAFGQNYAEPNAYGATQKQDLMRLVYDPADAACVVVVLPDNARGSTHVNQVRADLTTLANSRPRSVIVDWTTVVAAHPEYLNADHVHLEVPLYEDWVAAGGVPEPEAVAFAELVWSGVERC